MSELAFSCIVNSQDELKQAGELLLNAFKAERIFLFSAEMGVGKTTFIKELCRILGSKDSFSSPTFSIVNTYQSPHGPIYHFDLYRVSHVNELLDIGFEEYLDSGCFCFIEWPDLATELWPTQAVRIFIETHENKRYIRANKLVL